MHKKHLKKSDPCNDKNTQQISKKKKKKLLQLDKEHLQKTYS